MFYSRYNHFDDKYPDANMLMQMLLLGISYQGDSCSNASADNRSKYAFRTETVSLYVSNDFFHILCMASGEAFEDGYQRK